MAQYLNVDSSRRVAVEAAMQGEELSGPRTSKK
jgi:hypothetical protein